MMSLCNSRPLDLEEAVEEMYKVLKPRLTEAEQKWVEEGVEANEPYSSLLMLISYGVKTDPVMALKYFPLLEPEDRDEYSKLLPQAYRGNE